MFEMLAGRSPFDIVGNADNPDQNTEDYLFQGIYLLSVHVLMNIFASAYICYWVTHLYLSHIDAPPHIILIYGD